MLRFDWVGYGFPASERSVSFPDDFAPHVIVCRPAYPTDPEHCEDHPQSQQPTRPAHVYILGAEFGKRPISPRPNVRPPGIWWTRFPVKTDCRSDNRRLTRFALASTWRKEAPEDAA